MTLTMDDLQALIESLDWDEFQRRDHGEIYVHVPTKVPYELIRYSYRVGTHFKRPMEAIMAKGDFIRMRAPEKLYQPEMLLRLDPENVDGCLYTNFVNGVMTNGWKPPEPVIAPSQFHPGTVYAGPTLVGQGHVPPWAQQPLSPPAQGLQNIYTSSTTTGIASSDPNNVYQAQQQVQGLWSSALSSAVAGLGLGGLLGKA